MNNPLQILIVDDEPIIRDGLRDTLACISGVEALDDECGDGIKAVETIRRRRPDIVFLDIQMPGLDGFEVIEQLKPAEYGTIVFVTAYDEYAVRAFEINAVAYLLKPFDETRVRLAIERARERLDANAKRRTDEKINLLLERLSNQADYAERFPVTSNGRTRIVAAEEIEWIEAADNYVSMHLSGGGSVLLRETLKSLEKRLDPKRFVRIHRSTIVNFTKIKELQPSINGDYTLTLQNGRKLNMSRSYRDTVFKRLG